MSHHQEIELWLKLHAALCKKPRVRHALRHLTDKEEMSLADTAIKIIKQSGAFSGAQPAKRKAGQ